MQELIKKIEQWAEDRNIINGSKPIDQAMKLFSEFGELADNVGKGRDCRDDIGDVFVVLTIICKHVGKSISEVKIKYHYIDQENKYSVYDIMHELCSFIDHVESGWLDSGSLGSVLSLLQNIAYIIDATLEECVQIAYNDIKDRKGVMYNGVFIKESDPAYQDILDNIEADKRMATQKRVSVNIEDL